MRTLKIASVALLLTLAGAARAQVPPTPAGRQLAGWLEAFNSDRPEDLRRFLAANAPAATQERLLQPTAATFDFRERTGGFDFRTADSSTATRLSALVQERGSDQMARLTISVQPEAPHRITALSIMAVPRPPEFALPRTSEAELTTALRAKLAADAAAGAFAGAVMLAKDERVVFDGAYGLADREQRIANTLETQFRIGSMNKMFTAVAVLQLAQDGKLRLDAPLGTYLTDYPNKEVASKVTIHHLLTHTGGTGDIFGPQFFARRRELRTIHDYLTLYGARGLEFEPGSQWAYSNHGFLLLGAVIEKVSGTSYYDYVATHVFASAGMSSTASLPEDSVVPRRSVGYTRNGRTLVSNAPELPYRGTSAGGGYSTVGDLLRFATALREHKLLNPRYTELLTTGKVDARGAKYAYGFFDRVAGGVRFVGHGGGAPGMNGDLEIDPRSGYVIAVLSNLDPPAAQRVAEFITNRLPSAPVRP
ncbi:MAG: beta-lactamase family protein [Gemmatimonadota bacterium]|nr:beta-lactamase family protein [Gemmatimonadota bacterium]